MNPYDILGVDRNTSAEDIKKAYRKLSKELHPDKPGGDADKFKDLSGAYDILSDPEKKQNFDTFGDAKGGNGFSGFSGFDDILNMMRGGGGNPFSHHSSRTGSDVGSYVKVSLLDILNGSSKKVSYSRDVKCEPCNGKGGENVKKCTSCNGSGQVIRRQQTGFGMFQQAYPCDVCKGQGNIIENACKSCKGSGTSKTTENIDISIPAGVGDGIQITIQNGGNYIRNGSNGNLIIVIQEIPDTKFKRDGNNLHNDVWITISDAVLGCDKIIETPLGKLKFNIDKGCESGKVFNFNGKGVPNLGNNGQIYGAGNLYVKVNVSIPKILTDETKEIFEKLKLIENEN